jgi:hypothetical protein
VQLNVLGANDQILLHTTPDCCCHSRLGSRLWLGRACHVSVILLFVSCIYLTYLLHYEKNKHEIYYLQCYTNIRPDIFNFKWVSLVRWWTMGIPQLQHIMSRSTTAGLLLVLIPHTQPVICRRFVKQPSKNVQPVCNSAEHSNFEVVNRGSRQW